MRRVIKWTGLILGTLLLALVVGVSALYAMGNTKLNRVWEVEAHVVEVPTDEASFARGEHIATALSACQGCHGEDFAGHMFLDEEGFATIPAPNLTSGQGGIGGTHTDQEWVNAIRHGIGGDGRGLLGMPSQHYQHMSDEDLGALVAYLKQLPPVDQEWPNRLAAFIPTVLAGAGQFPMAVELVDHETHPPAAPATGPTAEYGAYLVDIGACRECHGASLAGLTDPNGPPPGPNLTPGGELAGWTQDAFFTAMREGTTPGGRQLSEEMPWLQYRNMTDDELAALWSYLQSLPARELGANE